MQQTSTSHFRHMNKYMTLYHAAVSCVEMLTDLQRNFIHQSRDQVWFSVESETNRKATEVTE